MQSDPERNVPIRVAVVDNHRLFRDGIIETLNETPDFKVIAAGERGSHAVRIAQDSVPEIMLLDLNMPEGGIESAREISALCPYVKTIILTSCDGDEHFSEMNEAGVRICVVKGVSATDCATSARVSRSRSAKAPPKIIRARKGLWPPGSVRFTGLSRA